MQEPVNTVARREEQSVTPQRLAAGGTIAGAPASPMRRAWLALELAAIFGLMPLAMHWAVHGERIPIFVALLPVLAVALVMLAADPRFALRGEFTRGFSWLTLASILALFAAGGAATVWWITQNHPGWLLEFPRNRPETYKRIMLLYPLFSVAAQELVYRTFYFHRYGPLFGNQWWLAILVNAVLFGFAHVVVGSTFAIVSTGIGGLVLAARYAATRSYWAVFLEHTLWGWLVFTVGLGRFFFTGVSNLN